MQPTIKLATTRRLLLLASIAVLLLLALAASLAGCAVSVAEPTPSLPHLLGVIQMHHGDTLLGDSLVHPNGLAYVTGRGGYVVVLKGTELVEVIPLPQQGGRHAEPTDLVINPHNGYVYVADQALNTVHVLSGTTIITSMPSLGYHTQLLTVDPTTGYIYVANRLGPPATPLSTTITVFSGTHPIAHIPFGYAPSDIVYNPVDQQIYVGHQYRIGDRDRPPGGMVTIISKTTFVTTTFLGLPEQEARQRGIVQQIAVNEQTGAMTLMNARSIFYWDGHQAVQRLPLGNPDYLFDYALAVDPKRGWAYAGSWDGPPSHVLVIDQDQVIAELPVGFDARHIAVDQTHDYVYVANRLTGDLSIIRGTEVITTLPTGGVGPSFISVDEPHGYIYVSNADYGGSISVFGFDTAADEPSFWQQFLPWLEKE